ncbi:MAG: hypothetical protein OZ917_01470 [Candidatus Brocadiaceae bacterium]|nr:hypothetical protein [Candidatus Brocadiaceae bacterium]
MKTQRLSIGVLMIAVFVTYFTLGTARAEGKGEYPNLTDWANTWFKVKLTGTTYHFDGIGVKPKPAAPVSQTMGIAYVHITNWDGDNHVLAADVYIKDDETGEWKLFFNGVDITYFAGSDLKFIGSAQWVIPDDVTLHLLLVFTGSKYTKGAKTGQFKLGGETKLSTIGGSLLEIDDAEDAPPELPLKERWAGSASISGPMVSESSLPFNPDL